MNKNRSSHQWFGLVAASLLSFVLGGCGGDSGSRGAPGAPGAPAVNAGVAALAAATTLNMGITGVTSNNPPVVNFTVTNELGAPMLGLTDADLRFNIAKLVPGTNGEPSVWQNYINRSVSGAVQGAQERKTTTAGYVFGTLVDNRNGSYTYTFATDITSPTSNPCPAPCTDASGKALDISFSASLTHRVTVQQANSAYPKATGTYDFVPGGAAVTTRDVVVTATCNQCHDQLVAHGTRVEVKLCVTCHNPGSWVAGTPNVPVDFKVMIHRIHNGINLPSVVAGGSYKIGSSDFSAATFPQDIRNCTKCHDGKLSAQGDNWKNQPTMQACGSCHDDVNFGAQSDPAKPLNHPGGVTLDNSVCVTCHGVGKPFDTVASHNLADKIPSAPSYWVPPKIKAAAAKFKFNIISVTGTAAGSKPVVTFSVTDPTNGDTPYDIKADPHFTSAAAALTVQIGWGPSSTSADFGGSLASGSNFGQPVRISVLNNAAVTAGTTAGTYNVTSTAAIPAAGTIRVMMDGHPAADVFVAGAFNDSLPVKNVFTNVAITGSTLVARRTVVAVASCDACHDYLSMHGYNRTEEPGVCVICHNPNATDAARRPTFSTNATLTGAGSDGKKEESIDFKRMIHGIHAGQYNATTNPNTVRTKGLLVYGFGSPPTGNPGVPNDFSGVIFPGQLNLCTNCHTAASYQLTGIWAAPVTSGILGSTVNSGSLATPNDPTDDLKISPTAAVCSSCHDSAISQAHMTSNSATFGTLTQSTLTEETCSLCHGPAALADVKVVHKVQ